MLEQKWIRIPGGSMIYRVRHRIMEGDCPCEHGPVLAEVKTYEIMKYPVTNGMFRQFIQETGYKGDGNFLEHWKNAGFDSIEDKPVVYVSLDDAKAYAAYAGGKLPSEIQWQYAAGGADGRRWPWGDDYSADFVNGDGGELSNVDAYPQGESPFGVADLCGNVWEWTDGPVSDGHRLFALLRGGCCYRAAHFWHMEGGAHPVDSHIKMLLLSDELNRAATVGFRCVREARDDG